MAYALSALARPFALAALVTFAGSAYRWWPRLARVVLAARAGLSLERLHGRHSARWRGDGEQSLIPDVAPGTWVESRRIRDERMRRYRVPRGVAARYQLCVAMLLDGGKLSVAYADGKAKGWVPRTMGLTRPYRMRRMPGVRYPGESQARSAAALLDRVVAVAAEDSGVTLAALIDRFDDQSTESLMHACRAAVMWGLVRAGRGRQSVRLYALVGSPERPDRSEAAAVTLRITEAGKVWRRCSREALQQDERKRRMDRSRKATYVFKGAVTAQHVGDALGDNVYHQYNTASAGILEALERILREDKIWARPGLATERARIAEAVQSGQVERPAVRSAVSKVLGVAGSLVSGVVGNTIYDVLKQFATG